jgi:TM2 domain-containing membrane protein YozV
MSEPTVPRRSLIVAYLLWFFLGFLGLHRFYTGRWISGFVWLLTAGLVGIGWMFDAVWTYVMCQNPK